MRRSKFQMTNRGRKDKPCWVVHDGAVSLFSSRRRPDAEAFLRFIRREERAERASTGGAA